MSGICGWIAFGGAAPEPDVIDRMAGRLSAFGGSTRLARSPAAALAAVARADDATAWHDDGGDLVAVHGRIHFADPELEIQAARDGRERTLLAAFRERGVDFLRTARGTFAVALVLGRERRALLAVDRLSIRPLSFARTRDGLVFGSDAAAVYRHPAVSRALDPQQLYNYLYFHMIPGPGSIYASLSRLGPGGYALLTDDRLATGTHWQPEYSREWERLSVTDLKHEFRELLREGVRREFGAAPIACFLSGGTDSSTVAGVVGELSGAPARTYSIGFDAEGYDETHYAQIAVRHFGTQHREYRVTPEDVAEIVPRIADISAEPFGNSSVVPAYYCARMARADGVGKMLAGDGGDELFGGNARYATQRLFSLYSDLPAAVRERVIEPLVFSFPGGDRLLPLRKLRSYIRQANVPMPQRLETYNLLERLGPENVLTPDFLATVDVREPLRLLGETYHAARAETLINRMLALDLKFTLADNDLPKVCMATTLADVDVAYPLLSDELIDFAARLPAHLKLRGTRLRYFFKEALRDFLPPEIIAKKKHGFGLPFGPWLMRSERLREVALDALDGVKRRGIVRANFVETLLTRHLPDHPGFYGTMVWLLVMLEHWHRRHVDGRG